MSAKLIPVPTEPKDPQARQIIKLHNMTVFFGNQTLMIAVQCGKLLLERKRSLPHGSWLPWIKENLPFSSRTAERYIKVWENRERAKTAYELEHMHTLSLRQFYQMLTDSKSIKPGLIHADKKRMIRDIVKPIRVVKNRLKHLPWYPSSYEDFGRRNRTLTPGHSRITD